MDKLTNPFSKCLIIMYLCSAWPILLTAQQGTLPRQLDSMIQLVGTLNDPTEKAKMLNTISFHFLNVDAQKAFEFAQKALKQAEEHQLVEQMGQAQNNLATYYVYKSEMEKALDAYEKSMDYFKRVGMDNEMV